MPLSAAIIQTGHQMTRMHRVEDAARLAMANIADCEAPQVRMTSPSAFRAVRWLPIAAIVVLAILWVAL